MFNSTTSNRLAMSLRASASLEDFVSISEREYMNRFRSSTEVYRGNVNWTWDHHNKSDNVEILNNSTEVRFNRRYSNGTAVVRCTEPMSNHQYYWEVKLNYPVYGTDVMVGVGTPEATIAYLPDRYVSRLGMDEQTWGFSRHGLFHHNGERRCYAQKFDQGDVIGVHLDFWRGTLSFYKDKKYLGVACSGLKDKTLYAMASSTAACSGMQLVYASCFPSSLQFLCVAKLRELVPDNKNVLDVLNVPPGLKQFLESNLSWLLDKSELEDDFIASESEDNFKTSVSKNIETNHNEKNDEDNVTKDIETSHNETNDESNDFIIPEGIFINILDEDSLSEHTEYSDSSPERCCKRFRFCAEF